MVALGRVYAPDDRDNNYRMATLLATIPEPTVESRSWKGGPLRNDQGNVGACVGYAGANWKQNKPIATLITNQTGMDDYLACKKIDPWPNEEGTNVRYLMQVYQQQGRIKEYRWATTPIELKNWILTTGPVLIGTNWYESMFDPDADGFVHISGNVAGGHETLVRRYYAPKDAYRVRNSWGPNWGLNGEYWIKRVDLERLVFAEQGDACAAIEMRPL